MAAKEKVKSLLSFKDLLQKPNQDLKILEEELRAELFALRFQHAIGNLEKPNRINELKKQIARILTIFSNRTASGDSVNSTLSQDLIKDDYKKVVEQIEEDTKAFQEKIKKQAEASQQSAMPGIMGPDGMPLIDEDQLNVAIDTNTDEESAKKQAPDSLVNLEKKVVEAVATPVKKTTKKTPEGEQS